MLIITLFVIQFCLTNLTMRANTYFLVNIILNDTFRTTLHCWNMLPIQRKTQDDQSINQSINQSIIQSSQFLYVGLHISRHSNILRNERVCP